MLSPWGDRGWVSPLSPAIVPRHRPPSSSLHLADTGHPRHQEPLEEIELVGRLLEEEVDLVVSRDAEGGHEGGVGCGAQPGQVGEELG